MEGLLGGIGEGATMIGNRKQGEVHFRFAGETDAVMLGALNSQLIKDEGHRNSMTIAELGERMAGWLQDEYQAVVIEQGGMIVGYALFRRESDHVYLRQLFVRAEHRRRGIGRSTMQWIAENVCQEGQRIRIDVLVGNALARSFWTAIGFREYCVTMEMDLAAQQQAR
jgi:GNAT superfamily N-acetyltransferase